MKVINQRGLQFEPRVQAVQVGETVRFANEDNETHNVHILTPGAPFNQSMSRGLEVDYRTEKPGLLRIVCDVHSHMRGFVVVSPTPYFAVCRADGKFTLHDVADGRYRLQVWHEMGQGTARDIVVKDGSLIDVGTLSVEAAPVAAAGPAGPVRNWAEVTDRVGVLLGEARAVVLKDKGIARARKLAEDAYFEEFEGSQMETAVRRHLGYQRGGEIEGLFRALRPLVREVGEKKASPAALADSSRQLMLALVRAGEDLNRLGVTDRTKLGTAVADASAPLGDVQAQERALGVAFDGVASLADAGNSAEAASAMASAYLDAFEPLERVLNARRPQDVPALEAHFNALRGRVDAGLKNEALAVELSALRGEVSESINRSRSGGTFRRRVLRLAGDGPARGGRGHPAADDAARAGREGRPARRWTRSVGRRRGSGGELADGCGPQLLVATSRGRTREQIEGWVMMIAAGVLFYVSYWLISQAESKRWTDFLKDQVARGCRRRVWHAGSDGVPGGLPRRGRDSASVSGHARRTGWVPNGRPGHPCRAGGRTGRACRDLCGDSQDERQAAFAIILQAHGMVLFGMAVVFAGNGVFALQNAKMLRHDGRALAGTWPADPGPASEPSGSRGPGAAPDRRRLWHSSCSRPATRSRRCPERRRGSG